MAVKILSVDDENDLELLLTQYFRRKIRKGEYEFFFAHNGIEALRVLLEQPDINIILSDINMPEMDGLTLLAKINELRNPALKCIMVSAYGDMGNIRTAMNNGAFDFATKPIDLDDLSVTIEKAIGQIDFVKKSQLEHTQLEMIKTDLAVAAEIQQAILPKQQPAFENCESKFDLAQIMIPAKDIGGDFYDFFLIDDTHLGIVIADVSGKGVPAALFMMVSKILVQNFAMSGLSPSVVLKSVNDQICANNREEMFVTVWFGILDTDTGRVVAANAGHEYPAIMRSGGLYELFKDKHGFVIGGMEGIGYKEYELWLTPGSKLFVYTDGVPEATNADNEMFGIQRMIDALNADTSLTPKKTLKKIRSSVDEFVMDTEPFDDLTMVCLEYKGK